MWCDCVCVWYVCFIVCGLFVCGMWVVCVCGFPCVRVVCVVSVSLNVV